MGEISMFDYEQPPTEEKVPTDYTGLKIGAMLVPVFFFSFTWENQIWD
jgi:hypothetical protein